MGWLIVVLVIAVLVGAVVLNHRTAAAAMEGVRFELTGSPDEVARAVSAAYCVGARATLRKMVTRLKVVQTGPTSFEASTKLGDRGVISIVPASGGSRVEAHATHLFVGVNWRANFRGIWALSYNITSGVYTLLGITPQANLIKRFQNGLPGRLEKQLRRTAAA